jgi:DinB superfamily
LRRVVRKSFTRDETLRLLAATPERIAAATTGVPQAHLRTRPSADEWSANEVLAHVRSCADVWGTCIARMLEEDAPTLRAINPRSWIKRTNYLDLEFEPSLRAYAAQRADLLARLQPLPPEAWSRGATVTGAGAVLHRDVLVYAQWLARHEQPHIAQIERAVKITY